MNRILLERLSIRNFKGFRDFVLIANGGNIDAFGDNGTGKTTVFDAFIWLLFGKDSTNRSDFEIKELDTAGKVRQHKLEHEVEGTLLVNGRLKTFRRVYSEKWTKKRGTATDSFEGHTTDYYVDGVPVKEKEFKAEVDMLIREDLFKLLTSPTFFNEQLKKEERRKILLDVCGDITDAEVIHSNKALEGLSDVLNGREIEKHVAVVKAQMKKINEEIKELPVRISEAQRSMPDVSDLSESLLQDNVEQLRAHISDKDQELLRIQNGGESAVKEKRLQEIEGELIGIKNRLQSEVLDKVAAKRSEVSSIQYEMDGIRRQIDDKQHRIKQNDRTIESREHEASRLRSDWKAANEQVFEGQMHDENCPTCKQSLPSEQIQAAQDKAHAKFNKQKSDRLEDIRTKGKRAAEEAAEFIKVNERLNTEISQLNYELEGRRTSLEQAEAELIELRKGIQDPSTDPDYQQLQAESLRIKQDITQMRDSVRDSVTAVQSVMHGLRAELTSLEEQKAKFAQVQRLELRILELEQQEKELATEYERLERELFLTEEFTRTKVSLLQSKIDSKFKHARFRLFEEQINGGLKEVCDTLYNGVPYDGGLNNAARINVGLDIINTLSQHYGFTAPIFIDNAEAVTQLADTDAQVIRLIVSEKDKQLRVVTTNNMQEAI